MLGVVLQGQAQVRYRMAPGQPPHTILLKPGTSYALEAESQGEYSWTTESLTVLLVYVPPVIIHRVMATHGCDPAYVDMRTGLLDNDRVLYLLGRLLKQLAQEESEVSATHTVARSAVQTFRAALGTCSAAHSGSY